MVQTKSKLDKGLVQPQVYILSHNRDEFLQWCQHHNIKCVYDYTVRILNTGIVCDNWLISSEDKLIWIKLTWGDYGP